MRRLKNAQWESDEYKSIAKGLCSSDNKLIVEAYERINEMARIDGLVVCDEIVKFCDSIFVRKILTVLSDGSLAAPDDQPSGWIDLMHIMDSPIKKLHCYYCGHICKGSNPILLRDISELVIACATPPATQSS